MGRSIFVGDVHGCARELGDLLDKISPNADDRVVFVGDLVARGPETVKVLHLARNSGGLCVLGNHEHRLLLARRAQIAGTKRPRLGPSHEALMNELSEEDWAFLEGLPLSLEFPDHNVRVVHAGIAPQVPFEEQQPWTLLHVRSLTKHGAPSDRYSEVSWAAHYRGDPHIVFGHNAQAGLQLHVAATGLDTGCVYGGALTALVLPFGVAPPPVDARKDFLAAVPSRARYVDYGPHLPKEPLEA